MHILVPHYAYRVQLKIIWLSTNQLLSWIISSVTRLKLTGLSAPGNQFQPRLNFCNSERKRIFILSDFQRNFDTVGQICLKTHHFSRSWLLPEPECLHFVVPLQNAPLQNIWSYCNKKKIKYSFLANYKWIIDHSKDEINTSTEQSTAILKFFCFPYFYLAKCNLSFFFWFLFPVSVSHNTSWL